MNQDVIEKSIQMAIYSLEVEGFQVDERCVELCRLVLAGEISMEEYMKRVIPEELINNAV